MNTFLRDQIMRTMNGHRGRSNVMPTAAGVGHELKVGRLENKLLGGKHGIQI